MAMNTSTGGAIPNKMVSLKRREKTVYNKYRRPTGETYELEDGTPKMDDGDVIIGWRVETSMVIYELPVSEFINLADKRYL